MVNIDAINPDWPRPIHLPDEEETLDKQVSSGAAVAARERGLVPQSGDWERPYRWVTPEEVEELEVDEADESESYETVDLEYARENLSPFSVRNNKGTNAKKQLEAILDSDVESVTVWHGTTLGGAKAILEDGMIRGYGGFGAGVTLDPHRAYTYTRGLKSAYDLPDADKYPVVMQFEIPKDMFQNFTPEVGGLGKDELLFNPRMAAVYRNETSLLLPDEYKNSEGEFPSHRERDIPLILDMDSVKFMTSEDVDIPAPEIAKPKSSSYEMPKYDMSWDALVETELKDVDLVFHPIEDADRTSSMFSDYIKDTDNFALSFLRYGQKVFFGESEEDIKEQILNEFISPEGRYFKSYHPPRLTSKPDWATDENDPFPEIPSDIKEIHYDDIPEFYKKNKYGDALQQFGSLKGISRKISEVAGLHSEPFYEALECVDGELDYDHAADVFSQELEENVTEKQAKLALNRLRDMTQKSLENRGLPEKFYVFRGGEIHNEDSPMPTSLSADTAAASYFSQKSGQAPYIAMYEVSRDDVFLDMNSMKSEGQGEEELIILGRNLKNPRMVRLPNQMVNNPEFHKSKSLDKQAVATSEPPDLSVAARMKARGLEWKKETHRWVRPEDIEEEEPKVHTLNRDEYFDALIARHLNQGMPELNDTQQKVLQYYKEELDKVIDDTVKEVKKKRGVSLKLEEDFGSGYISGSSTLIQRAVERVREDDPTGFTFFDIKDKYAIEDSIITPYLIQQLNELGKLPKTSDEFLPEGRILSIINNSTENSANLVDLYQSGFLDIDHKYAPIERLKESVIKKLNASRLGLQDREVHDNLIKFTMANLFKFIDRNDSISRDSIVSRLYEESFAKDRQFMREALLNSLKDEDLIHQIHKGLAGAGFGDIGFETEDVIAGLNHLAFVIYEDMLKNGDIDDLVEYFSDANIPMGLTSSFRFKDMPFHFLNTHVSVEEFGTHVDKFLTGGEILRRAGIEALSFIDPSHPSLLAMVDTEDSPEIMSLLASKLPVTALENLSQQASGKRDFLNVEERFKEVYDAWGEENNVDRGIPFRRDEQGKKVAPIRPGEEGYEEWREKKAEQHAYATRVTLLDKWSVMEFDNIRRTADERVNHCTRESLSMEDISNFHSFLSDFNVYSHAFATPQGQEKLLAWTQDLHPDFISNLARGFDLETDKPGLSRLFDELYYGTHFGKLHNLSKEAWEGSSSSHWGGALKESIGRQLDDKVIFHGEEKNPDFLDERLERERGYLFKDNEIKSANFNQESVDSYVRTHKALTRALLDVVLPDTDTVAVFRGTSGHEMSEDEYSALGSEFESANIISNSLSSYSLSESTASGHFAEHKENGLVINIPELHKDNIWSTFWSHSYQGGEREILVINHPDMDAYARSLAGPSTEFLKPNSMNISEIDDMYGAGDSENVIIDKHSDVKAYTSAIWKNIFNDYDFGNLDANLTKWMDSSQYDEVQLELWVIEATESLWENAKQNYDYLEDADFDEVIAVASISGGLGIMDEPQDYVGRWNSPDELRDKLFELKDKLKESDTFKKELLYGTAKWKDGDWDEWDDNEWYEFLDSLADKAYTWAENREQIKNK